jgi:hypothetical protein
MVKTCEACECSAWLARRSAFLPVLLVVPCAFTPAVAIAKSVIVNPSSLLAFSALVIDAGVAALLASGCRRAPDQLRLRGAQRRGGPARVLMPETSAQARC